MTAANPLRGPPVAVERRRVRREPRRRDRGHERVRVVVDEHVRPDLDGVGPLGRGTERHARHAVPVRLLLEAAGVGDDHAGLRRRRGEGEVPDRLPHLDIGAEAGIRSRARTPAVRGCAGKTDRLVEPREALRDPAEPLGADVGLAMDGGDHVRPRRVWRRDALAGDGREAEGRVRHHVADHLDAAPDALGAKDVRRPLVGAEEDRRQPIDLDPGPLLGHREVAAAETGLDVRDRDARRRGGARTRERRVRVAEDENQVGPLRLDERAKRRRQASRRRPSGGRADAPARRARARR